MSEEQHALSLAITRLAEYEGFSMDEANRRIKAVEDAARALREAEALATREEEPTE